MQLGENIYRLRTGMGLSQGELADRLGVSRQSVSKWENSMATPDLERLMKMAALFGVTLDRLVNGDGEEDLPAPEAAGEGGSAPGGPEPALRGEAEPPVWPELPAWDCAAAGPAPVRPRRLWRGAAAVAATVALTAAAVLDLAGLAAWGAERTAGKAVQDPFEAVFVTGGDAHIYRIAPETAIYAPGPFREPAEAGGEEYRMEPSLERSEPAYSGIAVVPQGR